MPAPQIVQNGYISSQTGGVLRFHQGRMTSNYHVRHRQDRERNQKESYKTGSIKDPLNRYSRKIGLGVGIDKQQTPEIIDVEDGVNPDEEVGPSLPEGGLDGASSALWSYFMPLNSFTCKCNKCQRTLNISSSEDAKLSSSSSPMVQHLMKCLENSEYKDFIRKRETRYETEKKELDKEKKNEVENAMKKGPLLTSVMKGAPIWCLFKQMTSFKPSGLPESENATCMIKGCYKVVRILRQSATAMIVHLADEHAKLHDLYVENHKRSTRELLDTIKEYDKEQDQINKVEKANKIANQQNINTKNDKPNNITLSFNGRKRKETYVEDEKTTREHEHFNNSNSTLREYFVPLGMLPLAKCKTCHSTVSVQQENTDETCKMEKHLKQKHFKDYEDFLRKKDDKKSKRVEKVQRKEKRKYEKEEKNSEEGKRKRENAATKDIMKSDAKATINRFTGTGNMLWKHFHTLPNSEMLKCMHCHRVFRRYKNSLGDSTVKLLEHLQTYHKELNDLFAL